MKIKISSQFKKDLKRMRKQGKDLSLLREAISYLENDKELPEKYKNHQLKGEWNGAYEFYIKADWLVIYEIIDNNLILVMLRTGSHQELFRNY
ncbi:type II toxin-antitoxin system YafQ family toxin [Anaerococcus provencensis]|uniref:type II toxin-antitoxin system YafQ family toxin n=1 Tax=Anaerococcus provencensis TaxID=938293 RepID=UPI000318F3B4|nr:type II toxin-antitoxin system YafQ family toxin [Anaerococcus provencensis]